MSAPLTPASSAPPQGLGSSAALGSFASVGTQFGRHAIQMIATVVLARLVAPADYGLFALSTAVTAFLGMFTDLGLSVATVQRADITPRQVSTMFWMNSSLGLALGALVFLLAPLAARAFNTPALQGVVESVAPLFLIGGLRVQHGALLARNLSFGRIAGAELFATAAGVGAGIAAALQGWGVYALVAQALAGSLAETLALWCAGWWLPGAPGPLAEIRAMLGMGGNLTAFSMLNYFARTADNLLIGRFLGVEPLGLYSRAYGLMMLPNTLLTAPLQRVMVPVLARLQDDHARFERAYFRAVRLLAAVVIPIGFGMAVLAEEIVLMLLGSKWTSAAPLLRVLAINTALQPLLSSTGWVYLARGRADKLLHWALFACPVIAASFVAGLPWGAQGIASAYTAVSAFVILPLGIAYACRVFNMPLWGFWKPLIGPFACAMAMAGAVFAIRSQWPGAGPARTLALIAAGALIHFALLRIFVPGLVAEAFGMLPGRRAPSAAPTGGAS